MPLPAPPKMRRRVVRVGLLGPGRFPAPRPAARTTRYVFSALRRRTVEAGESSS
jgi:hypothetical protein